MLVKEAIGDNCVQLNFSVVDTIEIVKHSCLEPKEERTYVEQ